MSNWQSTECRGACERSPKQPKTQMPAAYFGMRGIEYPEKKRTTNTEHYTRTALLVRLAPSDYWIFAKVRKILQ